MFDRLGLFPFRKCKLNYKNIVNVHNYMYDIAYIGIILWSIIIFYKKVYNMRSTVQYMNNNTVTVLRGGDGATAPTLGHIY